MRVTLLATPFATPRLPPLGVALLSAVLRREGHETSVIDLNHRLYVEGGRPGDFRYGEGWRWKDREAWPELRRELIDPLLPRLLYEIALTRPQFIGISAWHGEFCADLAGRLSRQHPGIPIVVGGPACSRVFGSLRLRPGGGIDAVVSGEGESVLPRLLAVYARTGELVPLPGVELWQDGSLMDGGPAQPLDALDLFPDPDFSDFPLAHYTDPDFGGGPALPLLHFRGCPGVCAFCLDRAFWGDKQVRHPSAARTAETVNRLYARHGLEHFIFLDLCLNPGMAALENLRAELARLALPVDFCGQARLNGDWTEEFCRALRSTGFVHLSFGLESGSDRILQAMGRGYDRATAAHTIRCCHQAGILVSLNLICGFPGETDADRDQSLEFVAHHAHAIWSPPSISLCAIPAASALAREPERFGIERPGDGGDPEEWLDRHTGADRTARQKERQRMQEFMSTLSFRRDREGRL